MLYYWATAEISNDVETFTIKVPEGYESLLEQDIPILVSCKNFKDIDKETEVKYTGFISTKSLNLNPISLTTYDEEGTKIKGDVTQDLILNKYKNYKCHLYNDIKNVNYQKLIKKPFYSPYTINMLIKVDSEEIIELLSKNLKITYNTCSSVIDVEPIIEIENYKTIIIEEKSFGFHFSEEGLETEIFALEKSYMFRKGGVLNGIAPTITSEFTSIQDRKHFVELKNNNYVKVDTSYKIFDNFFIPDNSSSYKFSIEGYLVTNSKNTDVKVLVSTYGIPKGRRTPVIISQKLYTPAVTNKKNTYFKIKLTTKDVITFVLPEKIEEEIYFKFCPYF